MEAQAVKQEAEDKQHHAEKMKVQEENEASNWDQDRTIKAIDGLLKRWTYLE